ncbi:MAG TPA: ribosome maturation factor RimM [Candidatus Nanopelagicales bacterium]|nr:ribosome maturation factor RimM [Candidatus Nanopelagicales bacterium]
MLVVVGRIGRPHGIRGAISIEVRTDEPDRRLAPGCVVVTDSGVSLRIESSTWHSGRLLLTFEGYTDRTSVEALRGEIISVERDELEEPDDPEEFYDSALVECQVFDTAGETIGIVREVAHLPAQDMLVVDTADGREVLIPFVAAIVPTVDIAERRIVVDPPPGLLDPED